MISKVQRTRSLWFSLITLLLFPASVAQSQVYTGPFETSINSNGTCTIEAVPPAAVGEVDIPETIHDALVSGLNYYAFYLCESVTSVTLPGRLTNIPDGVFSFCTNITAIEVASNNPAYTSLDGVLFNKDETELVAFPANNPATNYEVPSSVNVLLGSAFFSCRNLEKVTVSTNVTNIQSGCFSGCVNLSDFIIPDSVPVIANGVFAVCGLTNLTIPDSVTYIGEGAFSLCMDLTNINLGSGVAGIGSIAFQNSGLIKITIPDSVTSLGNQVFWYSGDLATVNIGSGVTNIGGEVFIYCTGLQAITVDSNNPVYSSRDGAFFDKGLTQLLQYPLASPAGGYVLPSTVAYIATWAFAGSGSLASVTFDSALTNIDEFAFLECPNLASVTVPSNVVNVAYQAFCDCPSLTNAVLEGSNIGSQAFDLCGNLQTVSFGPGVASIGSGAFALCPNLKALYFQGNAPALAGDAFDGDSATVYYLAGTSGWTNPYGGLPAVALNGVNFNATPTNGVAPLAVAFNAPSSDRGGNAITNWQWQFGDGSSSTAQNPVHLYAAGTYYPQLLATNNLGLLVLGSGPAAIAVLPQPGLGGVSLSGDNLAFTVSNAIPGTVYRVLATTNLALPLNQWTPAATNISSATGNFTITLTNAVTANVRSQFYILQSP